MDDNIIEKERAASIQETLKRNLTRELPTFHNETSEKVNNKPMKMSSSYSSPTDSPPFKVSKKAANHSSFIELINQPEEEYSKLDTVDNALKEFSKLDDNIKRQYSDKFFKVISCIKVDSILSPSEISYIMNDASREVKVCGQYCDDIKSRIIPNAQYKVLYETKNKIAGSFARKYMANPQNVDGCSLLALDDILDINKSSKMNFKVIDYTDLKLYKVSK